MPEELCRPWRVSQVAICCRMSSEGHRAGSGRSLQKARHPLLAVLMDCLRVLVVGCMRGSHGVISCACVRGSVKERRRLRSGGNTPVGGAGGMTI